MTVRDDLRLILGGLWPYTDEGWQDVVVDRVLVYLGRLDGSADGELVAAHLKAGRARITELEAELAAMIDERDDLALSLDLALDDLKEPR